MEVLTLKFEIVPMKSGNSKGNCLSGVCDWKEEAGFGTTNGRKNLFI
jgi:hypothetical protein